MKKIDAGQMITILANLGVIAGIVFLAMELRQNNNLLASQARQNILEARAAYQQNVAVNAGGLADILQKAQSQELSATERFRLNVHWSLVLQNWESIYQEVLSGPLSESDLPVVLWAATMSNNPDLIVFWERSKDSYSPGFNVLLEERVRALIND